MKTRFLASRAQKDRKAVSHPDNVARNVFEISHQNSYLGRKFLIVNDFFFLLSELIWQLNHVRNREIFSRNIQYSAFFVFCVLGCVRFTDLDAVMLAPTEIREKNF